jgi:hypothetical protein
LTDHLGLPLPTTPAPASLPDAFQEPCQIGRTAVFRRFEPDSTSGNLCMLPTTGEKCHFMAWNWQFRS